MGTLGSRKVICLKKIIICSSIDPGTTFHFISFSSETSFTYTSNISDIKKGIIFIKLVFLFGSHDLDKSLQYTFFKNKIFFCRYCVQLMSQFHRNFFNLIPFLVVSNGKVNIKLLQNGLLGIIISVWMGEVVVYATNFGKAGGGWNVTPTVYLWRSFGGRKAV